MLSKSYKTLIKFWSYQDLRSLNLTRFSIFQDFINLTRSWFLWDLPRFHQNRMEWLTRNNTHCDRNKWVNLENALINSNIHEKMSPCWLSESMSINSPHPPKLPHSSNWPYSALAKEAFLSSHLHWPVGCWRSWQKCQNSNQALHCLVCHFYNLAKCVFAGIFGHEWVHLSQILYGDFRKKKAILDQKWLEVSA